MLKKIYNLINAKNLKLLQVMTISLFALGFVSFTFIEFSLPLLLLTIFMYFLTFGFGVSATFHRAVTHKSIILHPMIELLGKFFASMGGTGSPISWVMTHRAHHKYSDTELDPHPPNKISKTLMGQYPKVETKGLRKFAESKFNRIMHRYYFLILSLYALAWGLIGIEFFFYGFLYPAMLTIFASNFVNKYAHSPMIGNYRLHETKDTSQNSPIVAFLTWGEGWHNTHHKYPGRASFSMRPWEIDVSFLFVQLLAKLGLARVKS
jgi:fatty-acid desaturase